MPVRAAILLLASVALPAAAADRFAAADADGNGTLSRTEMQGALPRLAPEFGAIDRNRDGSVSREELTAHLQTGKARSPAATADGFAEHFRRADSDGDGALSRSECERNLLRLAMKFERIDRDGDGWLTREELRAWFDGRRAARGKPTGATERR
jgi:Ca2+-binding EF-hand superfamily protein